MRKTWQKPKLVILVKGRPEEYVLSACKDSAGAEENAVDAFVDCELNATICGACDVLDGS